MKKIKKKEWHKKNCLDNFNFSKNMFNDLIWILYFGNMEFIKNENNQQLDIVDLDTA